MDPIIAVSISFVIFMGIAYRLGYRQSLSALDTKIEGIRQALEDATKARDVATENLNRERRRHAEITKEIEHSLHRAEKQAQTLRLQTLHDLDVLLNNRKADAEGLMDRVRQETVSAIQEEITQTTVETFKSIVQSNFTKAQHETLNDNAVAQILSQLNGKVKKEKKNVAPPQKKSSRSGI